MQTQIFIGDQRQHYENAQCRILKTMLPLGINSGFLTIEEITIAAGATVGFTPKQASHLLVLPLVGNFTFNSTMALNPGEVLTIAVPADEVYTVANEQVDEPCLFLVAQLSVANATTQCIHYPNLNEHLNNWVTLATFEETVVVGIAKMEGRQESVLPLHNHSILAFVVNGAFEMNGCLLHRGDALWLPNSEVAEWEALSNDAILLWVKKVVK